MPHAGEGFNTILENAGKAIGQREWKTDSFLGPFRLS
jgi:hypothetical protein